MADKDKMSAIAFPTVGCGKLRFNPDTVVNCFIRAKRDTGASVKVSKKSRYILNIALMSIQLLKCNEVK